MKNKQTGTEWLVEQLRKLAFDKHTHLGMGDVRVTQGLLDELLTQAREVERQHIEHAFQEGKWNDWESKEGSKESMEPSEYYDKTYNSKT